MSDVADSLLANAIPLGKINAAGRGRADRERVRRGKLTPFAKRALLSFQGTAATFRHAVRYIVLQCPKPQVFWVAASWIITAMQYVKPFGQSPTAKLPHCSVRKVVDLLEVKFAIPELFSAPGPLPTLVGTAYVDAGKEGASDGTARMNGREGLKRPAAERARFDRIRLSHVATSNSGVVRGLLLATTGGKPRHYT